MVWFDINVHRWRHLYVLRAHFGQMFANFVPSCAGAVAWICRCCRNGIFGRTTGRTEVVAVCSLPDQCISGDRFNCLLLCVQCIRRDKRQTGAGTLCRRWHQHTDIPVGFAGAADFAQSHQEFETFGTVLNDRQFMHWCWYGHHHVLCPEWYTIAIWATGYGWISPTTVRNLTLLERKIDIYIYIWTTLSVQIVDYFSEP